MQCLPSRHPNLQQDSAPVSMPALYSAVSKGRFLKRDFPQCARSKDFPQCAGSKDFPQCARSKENNALLEVLCNWVWFVDVLEPQGASSPSLEPQHMAFICDSVKYNNA